MDSILSVLYRLKCIKKIHDESSHITEDINNLHEGAKTIAELTESNRAEVSSLKSELNKEFDQIIKDIEACEKDLASLS